MYGFFSIFRTPITQIFTDKHRRASSSPPLPAQLCSARTDVHFLNTERLFSSASHLHCHKGRKKKTFSCYFILSIQTNQNIIYCTCTAPITIQGMVVMHHSLASLFTPLSVGCSCWQPVCFFLGSRLFAMATLVQIQLIFGWHMPQVFLL